jgi:hypothetical protein
MADSVDRRKRAEGIGKAWLWLCAALALHVLDEASNGFLAVYNPTVLSIRGMIPWLPLPVFRFDVWLTGLIAAIAALSVLSIWVFRGVRWTLAAAYVFAIFMILNAVGHAAGTLAGRTVESVHFSGPMPGFYSSPFLLVASIYLLYQLQQTDANRSTS